MKLLLTATFLLFSTAVPALQWQESPQVRALFRAAGVQGTFVMYDLKAGRLTGYDRTRAETRFIPASTFKVPHTLIGLSTGAVASVDEILPYGGGAQAFKAWEKDMSLRSAIPLSNVPIYRALARRIGPARMHEHVARLGYGNRQTGSRVDNFWLEDPLEVSAVEQTRFLAALATRALPYAPEHQKIVGDVIRLEKTANWTLYGKTGWVNAPDPGVGWWVGWVETAGGGIYAFALNLDVRSAADADKRLELGRSSLKVLGVL